MFLKNAVAYNQENLVTRKVTQIKDVMCILTFYYSNSILPVIRVFEMPSIGIISTKFVSYLKNILFRIITFSTNCIQLYRLLIFFMKCSNSNRFKVHAVFSKLATPTCVVPYDDVENINTDGLSSKKY